MAAVRARACRPGGGRRDLRRLRGLLDGEPPSPSVADVFYLAGYPLLAIGVLLVLRRLGGRTSRTAMLDTAIIFSGVALVQWVFFIDPYNHMRFRGPRARGWWRWRTRRWTCCCSSRWPSSWSDRRPHRRLPAAARERRALGRRRRGLRPEREQLPGRGAGSTRSGSARTSSGLQRRSTRRWRTSPSPTGAGCRGSRARGSCCSPPRCCTAPLALLIERAAHHRVHAFVIALGGAALAALVLLPLRRARARGRARRCRRARRTARVRAGAAAAAYQNQQLLEIDRLKDEFVSSISHELRTPLTSIAGYVELFLEEEEDAGETRSPRDRRAQRGSPARARQRPAVRGTLAVRPARAGARPVDLRRLVEQAIDSARPRAQAAAVELHLETVDVPRIQGEPAKLAQLLDNLVSNAIKFTPRDGRVGVR